MNSERIHIHDIKNIITKKLPSANAFFAKILVFLNTF